MATPMLVDTNVLVDVLQNDPDWAEWSIAQLRAQAQIHRLFINPVIYAELSLAFSTMEALDEVLAALQIPVVDIPKPALFLAGKAFVKYQRLGATKTNVPPDFFIGAHAAVARLPLLTRDVRRYAAYFPTVPLITPEPN
jgi:predicted nucleic acid-binding protein